MKLPVSLMAVLLAVCGCAAVAPPTAPQPPASAASAAVDRQAAAPAALTKERQWLQSWFEGTPVRIDQAADGAVTVEVPRDFCFDRGRSSVKPPLAVVLDKVAESLRRVPLARLSLVAAPGDDAGTASLAMDRAAQVHKHLLSRGVPAARLARPTVASTGAVQLRMEAAPL
jgi:outer membrane protein OmpA-like peptidoglycan-associated protein